MMRRGPQALIVGLALLASASAASADMIWPPLVIARGLSAWPPIAAGLLVEFIYLVVAFRFPWKRAVVADILMNAASAAVGVILLRLVFPPFATSAGVLPSLAGAVATMILEMAFLLGVAAVGNAAIEMWVLQRVFATPFTRQRFLWLIQANALSVALAAAGWVVWSVP